MGTIGNPVKQGTSTRILTGDALNTLQDLINGPNLTFTTTGTSTAYVLDTTASFAPTLSNGAIVFAKIHTTCGLNPTLNVNNTGAKSILIRNLSQVRAKNLQANYLYTFQYYAATDQWICLDPTFTWSDYTDNGGSAISVGGAGMTVGSVTVEMARYKYDPLIRSLEIQLGLSVPLSGTPSPQITVTLPSGISIDSGCSSYAIAGGGTVYTGTADLSCHMERSGTSTTQLRIMKADAANYGVATHNFKVTGLIQTA